MPRDVLARLAAHASRRGVPRAELRAIDAQLRLPRRENPTVTATLSPSERIRFWHTTFNTVGNVVMFATEADVRLTAHTLLSAVGLPPRPLPALDARVIRELGAERIAAAAAAAACADPAMVGRDASVLRAWRAAVQLACRAGVRSTDIAAALSIATSSVRRHRAARRDDRLLAALVRRLALEALCAAS